MKRTKRKNIYLFCILLILMIQTVNPLINPICCAANDKSGITALYSQAKEMFRKANELAATDPDESVKLYQKSAMRLEKIVREHGIQNGKLYYNIGNIYFRMKDIGRAILNYRRGEQHIPNDSNLQQNLNYAREKRMDKIEEQQKTKVLKTLFFWHYDFSTKTRIIICTIFFMLFWLFCTIRLFIKKGFIHWSMLATILLALLFCGSLITETIYLYTTKPGVIISAEVVARKGNSETYEPSFKEPLHSGTEFTLIENRGNWYHIELHDARKCWVLKSDVELLDKRAGVPAVYF